MYTYSPQEYRRASFLNDLVKSLDYNPNSPENIQRMNQSAREMIERETQKKEREKERETQKRVYTEQLDQYIDPIIRPIIQEAVYGISEEAILEAEKRQEERIERARRKYPQRKIA